MGAEELEKTFGSGEDRAAGIAAWMATLLSNKLDIYGKKPPSPLMQLVPKAAINRGSLVNGGNSLRRDFWRNGPLITPIYAMNAAHSIARSVNSAPVSPFDPSM
jgi:hypothetical protein